MFETHGLEHMFTDAITLPDHQLLLGLMHPTGKDLCVAVYDGKNIRHMTAAKAVEYVDFLKEQTNPFHNNSSADPYAPVINALNTLIAKINTINTSVIFNRAKARISEDLKQRRQAAQAADIQGSQETQIASHQPEHH